MTFDEWLRVDALLEPASKKRKDYELLLKLVRAQRAMLDKVLEGKTVVLGPNSRKLMDEIEDLEAALMEKD